MKIKDFKFDLSVLFLTAFLLRLLFALPGIADPALLFRPDSASYLNPAMSMLRDLSYSSGGVPTGLRVPLYPLMLSLELFVSGGSPGFCVVAGCAIGALAVPVIFLTAISGGFSRRMAWLAALFYAFSPTACAFAPMFLSDSLFSVICAFELYFLTRYMAEGKRELLYAAALTGGLGCLTRPLNLLWFIFCIAAAVLKEKTMWLKVFRSVFSVLLFLMIIIPWVVRNHAGGFGWRIDTVSADSLRHNASVVESRVTGIPAEEIRKSYDRYCAETFSADPAAWAGADSRLSFQEKFLAAKLREHPFIYLRGFMNPALFVPDIPTLFENIGLSVGGRGTWDVIVKDGFIAGVRHYFHGKTVLLIFALTAGVLTLVFYAAAAIGLYRTFRERNTVQLLLFFSGCAYYLFVVGPVTYPRFHLPALPWMCISAAYGIVFLCNIPEKIRKKQLKNPENGVKL